MEQAARLLRCHEVHADRGGTSGFACEGDVVRVAAEGRDVGFDPAHGEALVFEAEDMACAGCACRRGHEAEHAEAVVHAHHDGVHSPGEAVQPVERGRAADEGTAVYPHEDGALGSLGGGKTDVERQAVFLVAAFRQAVACGLRAGAAEVHRGADAGPRPGGLRHGPARLAGDGGGIGDAAKFEDAIADEAFDFARSGGDDFALRRRLGSGGGGKEECEEQG